MVKIRKIREVSIRPWSSPWDE